MEYENINGISIIPAQNKIYFGSRFLYFLKFISDFRF